MHCGLRTKIQYLLSTFGIICMYLQKGFVFLILFLKGQMKIRHYSLTHAISNRKSRIIAKKPKVWRMFLINPV